MTTNKEDLIFAYILNRTGGAKKITWEDVNQWQPEQGILWVHANYTSKKIQRWLANQAKLSPITIKALTTEDSRPRGIIHAHDMAIVLRGVNLNPGHEPEDMIAIRIWLDENRIISLRNRRSLSIEDLRLALEEGQGATSAGEFLVMLCDRLIFRIANIIDDLEENVDRLEEAVMNSHNHLLRQELCDIRQQAIQLRRYLAPQRETIYRFLVEKNALLSEQHILHLREISERLIRHIEDLDATRDRAVVIQEELTTQLSEQVEKRMYLLALVTIIFSPLTFLTGLLGMNVPGIPGAQHPWGFTMVCIFLLFVLAITLLIFKKKELI